jgi:hypothetical protein
LTSETVLGGKLEGVSVIFGQARGDLRVSFEPEPHLDGSMSVGFFDAERWSDQLKAELNGHNRGLWDKDKNKPAFEYRAIEYASEIKTRLAEIIHAFNSKPTRELQEQLPDLPQIYSALSDLMNCCDRAQDGRSAKRLGMACKIFAKFNTPQTGEFSFDSPIESDAVRKIKNGTVELAHQLQRPPTRKELRHKIGWNLETKEFNTKLADAGLGWLPTYWQVRKELTL